MILSVYQYRDRAEAGQMLARQLAHYANRVDSLVLAMGASAVPIAVQVAQYLGAPLDTFTVRTLAAPGDPATVLGAVAPGGVRVLDDDAIRAADVSTAELDAITGRETRELERWERHYRGHRPSQHIAGRVIILIKDGFTTDWSMHAAVIALHQKQPAWLVAAAPVGSPEACHELANEVHEVVCPLRPEPLQAVGLWYDHFAAPADDEVRACLRHAGELAV